MGLRDTVRRAAVTAVTATGDIAVTVTYIEVREQESGYDTETGAVTKVEIAHPDVDVIFDQYSSREVDGEVIKPKDVRILLPSLNLPTGVRPKKGDRVQKADGEQWRVVDLNTDPVEALWEMQSRIFDEAPKT